MEAAKALFKVPIPDEVDPLHVLDVTTVMFRYIPRRFTDGDVLAALEKSLKREAFDYVYVPWSATSTSNMGYAFVNFLNPYVAHIAMALFDKASWKCVGARTPMKVEPAHVQGLAANVLRSTTSKARVFHQGVEIPLEVAIEMQRGSPEESKKESQQQEESKTSSSTTTTSSGEDCASCDPASSSDGSWRRSLMSREHVEQINAHQHRRYVETALGTQFEMPGSPGERKAWTDPFENDLRILQPTTSIGIPFTVPEEILTPQPSDQQFQNASQAYPQQMQQPQSQQQQQQQQLPFGQQQWQPQPQLQPQPQQQQQQYTSGPGPQPCGFSTNNYQQQHAMPVKQFCGPIPPQQYQQLPQMQQQQHQPQQQQQQYLCPSLQLQSDSQTMSLVAQQQQQLQFGQQQPQQQQHQQQQCYLGPQQPQQNQILDLPGQSRGIEDPLSGYARSFDEVYSLLSQLHATGNF